jgi:putative tricarboxylic transport membrane protein
MPRIKRADLVAGLGLCALAAYVYTKAAAMPGTPLGLGPGGYPKFVAVGLLLLGAILAVQSFLTAGMAFKPSGYTWARFGRVAAFVVICVAYALALRPLGFVLASVPYLIGASYFFGYRRHGIIFLFGIGLPLLIYGVFRHIFLVLLPTGTIF